MKNILIIIALFCAINVNAQTIFTMQNMHDQQALTKSRDQSPVSAYFGANTLINVGEDLSITGGARAMYLPVYGDNYGIGVLSNVAFNSDSTSLEDEFSIGVLPYFTVVQNDRLSLNLHGGFNYTIPDFKNTESTEFEMLVGAEVALYPNDGGLPFTLNVAPEYELSIQDANVNTWTLGVEGVVPIQGGLAVMVRSGIPFDSNEKSTFGLGILVGGIIK